MNKHSDRKRSAHSGLDRKSGFAKTDNVRRIRNRTRLFPNRIESGHVSTAPVRITNSGIRLPLSAHRHCLRRIVSDASFSTAFQTHRPSRVLTAHEKKNSSADRTKFRIIRKSKCSTDFKRNDFLKKNEAYPLGALRSLKFAYRKLRISLFVELAV